MSSDYYNRITLCGDREQVTATIAFFRPEGINDSSSDDDGSTTTGSESENDENHIYSRKEYRPKYKRKKFAKISNSHHPDPEMRRSEVGVGTFIEEPGRNVATNSDYLERIAKVVQENAKKEYAERKKSYEELMKHKENIEIRLKTSIEEVALDSSKLQKHEEDIQIWKNSIFNTDQKIEFLDEEIRELDEKLQCLKSKRLELSLDKRSFEGIVQEKSAKSRILKQQIELSNDQIEKSRLEVDTIQNQIDNVFQTKVKAETESDPFLAHLDKQIAQKSSELECPVCFMVCQPPILRCPEYHLVCGECWPRLKVCGECRGQYEGRMRHRYAERTHQDLQDLLKTRKEHCNTT